MESHESGKEGNAYSDEGGILGTGLYAGVVILDTSEVEDEADYGGLLYELKKLGIKDGEQYQIDNGGDLLMSRSAFERCQNVLTRFRVRPVNL